MNWNPICLQYLQQHKLAHQQMMQQMMAIYSKQGGGASASGGQGQNVNKPSGVSPSATPNPMENIPGTDNNAQTAGVTLNG